MIASLFFLPLASAAPLGGLGGLGSFGGLTGSSAGHADIEIFASAFVSTYTGGSYDTCNNLGGYDLTSVLNIGLGLDLDYNVSLALCSEDHAPGCNVLMDLQLLTSKCHDFNGWAVGQCFNKYSECTPSPDNELTIPLSDDHGLCTELGAYLTATWYAWSRGWAGADFFACLGVDYVTRWHSLLGGVCHYSGCPQDQCHTVTSQVSARCSMLE